MTRKDMIRNMNKEFVTWYETWGERRALFDFPDPNDRQQEFWQEGYLLTVRSFATIIRGVRRWVQRSVAHIRYRPGGGGYKDARADSSGVPINLEQSENDAAKECIIMGARGRRRRE